MTDGVDYVGWVGEFLEQSGCHVALVDGEEDACGLVDVGNDGAIVIVEDGDCGGGFVGRGMDARVVLVAEREVVGEGKVAA